MIFLVPILCFVFLLAFGGILIPWQASSTAEKGSSTIEQSERIYRDYDLYLKVTLALVAAFGYVRFEQFPGEDGLGHQALVAIGAIGLLVMMTFCIFVICHLGSKVRRWENIEWPKAIFWQELWACISMWLFSSSMWVAAWLA